MRGAAGSGFPRAAGNWVRLLLWSLASPGHGFLPSFQASSPPPHPGVAFFSVQHPQPLHDRFLPAWPGGSSPDPCPAPGSLSAPSPAQVAPHSSLSQLLGPFCLSSESSPPRFLTARLSPGRFPVPLEHGAGHLECQCCPPASPLPFPGSLVILLCSRRYHCSGSSSWASSLPLPLLPLPPPTTRCLTARTDLRLSAAGRIVRQTTKRELQAPPEKATR